jgi:hypothetical protein
MIIAARSPEYAKALAWIVREGRGGKVPRDPAAVAGWRVVNLTAALFDKSVRDVANDVVEFARAINGEMEIGS